MSSTQTLPLWLEMMMIGQIKDQDYSNTHFVSSLNNSKRCCFWNYVAFENPTPNTPTNTLSLPFPLDATHADCLSLQTTGTQGILWQFLPQSPGLPTNIVKLLCQTLCSFVCVCLECSYCVSSMCVYRDHLCQTVALPSGDNPLHHIS